MSEYKKCLCAFLDYPWERRSEIDFVDHLRVYYNEEFCDLSDSFVHENIGRIYEDAVEDLIETASSEFIEMLESLT
jgi:hypothetical protein